ncbi:hypothetical protein Tco_0260826 [Tanacetum coccineum]
MCRQPLPQPLSPPSAKLMIIALEEYGYQSRRGIRVPKKWRSSYSDDVTFKKKVMKVLEMNEEGMEISKITRKPLKTGKHGHGKWKSTREAKNSKPKAGKVKKSKLLSTLGQFSVNKRSGKTLEGPSTPLVPTPVISNPQKEPEQNPETSTEKVKNLNLENTAHVLPPAEKNPFSAKFPKPMQRKKPLYEIQDLNSPRPIPSKLPYPERMKVRENDKPSAQHSRFLKMFKQPHLEIGLKDALVEMLSSTNVRHNLAYLDSLPPGNDDSTIKKDLHEENFQVYSNPLFKFDDNFKSSNVNPLFEENDKDVEIKSSFTLTSPEESKIEEIKEKDSIPPGIGLTLPPTLEVSSSNPTSHTLTGEKGHS